MATTPASAWAPTWRPRAAAAAAAVAWLRWPAPGRAASAESCGSRGTSPGNEQETFSGKDRMTVPQSVESLHMCGSSFGPENQETSIGNSTQKPRRFTQLQLLSATYDSLKDICQCLLRLLGVSSTASGANPSAELECGSLWRLPWRSVATELLLLPKTCTNSDDRRFCGDVFSPGSQLGCRASNEHYSFVKRMASDKQVRRTELQQLRSRTFGKAKASDTVTSAALW